MELTPSTPPSDKREALKWHNRRAIVQAAAELARENGVEGFTVNDLAEAAGVSRRTVFNHFSGVEDAVQASFLDAISGLYAEFHRSLGDERFPDLPAAFKRFAEAAADLDVIGTVCQATFPFRPEKLAVAPAESSGPSAAQTTSRSPGADASSGVAEESRESGGCGVLPAKIPDQSAADLELLAIRATDSATRKIVGLLNERVDHVDPFEAHLLGEYLTTTMTVCADRWFAATHGELNPQTRKLWVDMLKQAMSSLGRGFGT